jgi:hypothetical protein
VVVAYTTVLSAAAGQAAPTVPQLATLGMERLSEPRLPAMTTAIASTPDDGSAVDTVTELQAVIDSTLATGVTMSGPVSVGRDAAVTLTLQVVDAQGRPTALLEAARVRLTSTASGTFTPASPMTLAAGTGTTTVGYASGQAGAQTLTLVWLEGQSDTAASGRTGGSHTLTVQPGLQTLTFAAVATQALSVGSVPLTATTTSGLAVTLTSQTPSVCTVIGATARLLAAGTCTVQATQPGDAQWQAAAAVTQSFAVVLPTVTLARAASALGADGGSEQFSLTVSPSTLAWQAVSSAAWLSTASTGVGSGTVAFTVAANAEATSRAATISVGGQVHTVTQAGAARLTLRVGEVRGRRVRLEWTYDGPATEGFVVEGDVVPGGRSASLAAGAQTFLTVEVPVGRFFVRVRTVEDTARARVSNEVPLLVGQPEVPSAPVQLTGTALGNRLSLTWTNTFTGGEPTDIDLVVGGPLEGRFPLGLTDSLVVEGVPPGTYTLSVVARNATGTSVSSNPVTLAFPGGCVAPQAPTWVTYGVSDRTVTVTWQAPAGGGAPTDYWVTAEGLGTLVTRGARAAQATLPPGTYRVWVQAVNPCGASAPSVVQTIVVP